jgi:hypothetical protein
MDVAKWREVKGEWDLGTVQPDTSFRHAPPAVKKYSSTHPRVRLCACVRACMHCAYFTCW